MDGIRSCQNSIYVQNSVTIKEITTPTNISDLPIISILARKGKGSETLISTHYREFTRGISGINTPESQIERLKRIIEHWHFLDSLDKETIIIGDTNLCFSKWNNTSYPQQNIINIIKDAQTSLALQQLVDTKTRLQLVNGSIEKSIIDHVYTNCPPQQAPVKVVPAGSSDHLGIIVKKYSKFKSEHPRSFKFRNHDCIHELLHLLHINDINNLIAKCKNLNYANETFK